MMPASQIGDGAGLVGGDLVCLARIVEAGLEIQLIFAESGGLGVQDPEGWGGADHPCSELKEVDRTGVCEIVRR